MTYTATVKIHVQKRKPPTVPELTSLLERSIESGLPSAWQLASVRVVQDTTEVETPTTLSIATAKDVADFLGHLGDIAGRSVLAGEITAVQSRAYIPIEWAPFIMRGQTKDALLVISELWWGARNKFAPSWEMNNGVPTTAIVQFDPKAASVEFHNLASLTRWRKSV